jgi:hypothetical protein
MHPSKFEPEGISITRLFVQVSKSDIKIEGKSYKDGLFIFKVKLFGSLKIFLKLVHLWELSVV